MTIFPDSLVAAKDVGIADAVPGKTVYLTTGNPKTIIFGKNTIKIKKATWPVAAVAKSSAAVRIVNVLFYGRKRIANRSICAYEQVADLVHEWFADRTLKPRTRAETRSGRR